MGHPFSRGIARCSNWLKEERPTCGKTRASERCRPADASSLPSQPRAGSRGIRGASALILRRSGGQRQNHSPAHLSARWNPRSAARSGRPHSPSVRPRPRTLHVGLSRLLRPTRGETLGTPWTITACLGSIPKCARRGISWSNQASPLARSVGIRLGVPWLETARPCRGPMKRPQPSPVVDSLSGTWVAS